MTTNSSSGLLRAQKKHWRNCIIAIPRRCLPSAFMLRHEALAEEATPDIFLNIWLKCASYNGERGEPTSWIMGVTHHKAIDIIRSRRRNINITDPKDYETLDLFPSGHRATDDEAVLNLERDRIMKALAVLPEAQREVIMLAYFEGYTQSEISSRLN